MKFVDQVRIHAKAGNGGDGCCSFRREKFVPKGGPDGGNGGDGGSIILKASVNEDNLVSLYYESHICGKHGENGQGKGMHGKSMEHRIVHVPVGTLIYRLPDRPEPIPVDEQNFDEEDEAPRKMGPLDLRAMEPIADLSEPDQEFILCQGGKGGKGNNHFKTSTNRAPRRTTPGQDGEEGWYALELQTIADVGLVGYPNAGKSTLITQISAAHPRVAPYPFTTLTPVVGVVELNGYRRVTVADIPGLIEGAHDNKGLGHEFLRHVVRCKLLLFVLDMAGSEGREPIEDFQTLRQELKLYDPNLSAKPWAVVANKMDLPEAAEHLKNFRNQFPKAKIVEASAAQGEGMDAIRNLLEEM